MALIRVDNAKLSLGGKHLFSNVSFAIGDDDRVALVGNNGTGKSSLVKAMLGEIELDKGTIQKKKGLKVGYVSQEVGAQSLETSAYDLLLQAIPEHVRDSEFWKADSALSSLQLNADLWHVPLSRLSGGWRRLVVIAAAEIAQPDLIVLDEPTNHLDLGKVFKLEDWLTNICTTPYLLISHDREFLDKMTKRTLILRADGVHSYDAPYSMAKDALIQEDIVALKASQREASEIDRLEKASKRLRDWGIGNASLAKRGVSVQTRADKIKAGRTQTHTEQKRDLKLHFDKISSNVVFSAANTVITTPDNRKLFEIGEMSVHKGDRVAVLGLNGTGKSMLLKALVSDFRKAKDDPEYVGQFKFSPQVQLGYLDQHLGYLPLDADIAGYIKDKHGLDQTSTIRELVNAGFAANTLHRKIGDLSYGERARISLLSLKLSKPNFYLLDEPTNHLDIQGQDALEEALDVEGQSCLFVSHDRKMIKSVPTRYFEIKNGRLEQVDGPESYFLDLQAYDDNQDNDISANNVPSVRGAKLTP